jgi:hypothetical protein
MNKGRSWTEEEDLFLIENYPTMLTREIAEKLGRSMKAINTRAMRLGLTKTKETISETKKTRYDVMIAQINAMSVDEVPLNIAYKHKEWLRIHYYEKELSESDIAEITGCTRKNIEYWMEKFGLPRRDNETRYTKRYLKKISETSKGRIPFSKGLTKYDHPSIMKISEKLSGENSPSWKGGTMVTSSGYRKILDKSHPHADKDGYILEHRAVMEFVLGRLLEPHEVVHHRDGNRRNNFIENLFLFPSQKAHTSFHNYKKFVDPNITEEKFMEEVFEIEYPN